MKTIVSLFALSVLLSIPVAAQNFTLKSTSLSGQANAAMMFNNLGCSGENLSPQLNWTGQPAGTKSYAITMYDPDAPTGSGWWHWVVFDIPASVSSIEEGASINDNIFPANAIESLTDFGFAGYGGPCPPEGDTPHMYLITVYALNTDKLGLNSTSNPATVGFYINSHTIAKASLVVYSKR